MKKYLLSLAAVALASTPMLADDALYTCLFGKNYNSKGVSAYDSEFTATNEDHSWTITNFNNNNNGWAYVKCGSKNFVSTGYITTDFAMPETLTHVDVTIDAVTAKSVNSATLYASVDGENWTSVASYAGSNLSAGTLVFTPTETLTNQYYQLAFDCQQASNGLVTISKVEYFGVANSVEEPVKTLELSTKFDFINTDADGLIYGYTPAKTLTKTLYTDAPKSVPFDTRNDSQPVTITNGTANFTISNWEGASSMYCFGFAQLTAGLRKVNGTATTSFSLPDGQKITKIVIACTNSTMPCTVGGVDLVQAGSNTAADPYTYTWERPADFEGTEVEVIMTGGNANINWIEVTYEQEFEGKLPAEIAFPTSVMEASFVDSFLDTKLTNPHNIPVTFTSSDESVIAMGDWGLELKGVGQTTITASWDETEEYSAGETSVVVNVVAKANSVDQMISIADKGINEVTTNCTLLIAYSLACNPIVKTSIDASTGEEKKTTYYEQYYFLEDYTGAPLLCYNGLTTSGSSYPKDKFYTAGKTAVYSPVDGMPIWNTTLGIYEGGDPGDGVTYETITALDASDVARVVYLNNVTVKSAPDNEQALFEATLEDGTIIPFYTKFKAEAPADAIYNVLGTVGYAASADSEEPQLVFWPLEYEYVGELATAPEFPTAITFSHDGDAVTVEQATAEESVWGVHTIDVKGETGNETITLEFDVPEGWHGILMMCEESEVIIENLDDDAYTEEPIATYSVLKANPSQWVPVDQLKQVGCLNAKKITFPADNFSHEAKMFLVHNGNGDYSNQISLNVKVKYSDPAGVETIEAAAEDAEYYTIDGVKVANPTEGLYVKVANGKAEKVVIK